MNRALILILLFVACLVGIIILPEPSLVPFTIGMLALIYAVILTEDWATRI